MNPVIASMLSAVVSNVASGLVSSVAQAPAQVPNAASFPQPVGVLGFNTRPNGFLGSIVESVAGKYAYRLKTASLKEQLKAESLGVLCSVVLIAQEKAIREISAPSSQQ